MLNEVISSGRDTRGDIKGAYRWQGKAEGYTRPITTFQLVNFGPTKGKAEAATRRPSFKDDMTGVLNGEETMAHG